MFRGYNYNRNGQKEGVFLERSYIAIDLKSYYASVECAALCLDPLTTNLVVADSRKNRKNDMPCGDSRA